MKYLFFSPELARKAIRLTSDEQEDPMSVIKEFFEFYDLNALRVELGNWLEYAFGSDDHDLTNGDRRVNLMQFSYQVEALLEAIHIMHIQPGFSEKTKKAS
jgi:hypothetical protein